MMADLLKNTVISLKQSLVYTLSLGDKELFHSNILGWLLENHNDKGIQPIVKLFINDELEIERVEREKNHLSLNFQNLLFILLLSVTKFGRWR